jgi:hypothetical protein
MKGLLIFGITFLLIESCGSKSDNESSSNTLGLEGNWITNCLTLTQGKDVSYLRGQFSVSGSTMKTTRTRYSDEKCSVSLTTKNDSFQVKIGSPVIGLEKTYTLDSTLKSSDFRITDGDVSKVAIEKKWFGYQDWVTNVSKDISGKKFAEDSEKAVAKVGDAEFDIVQLKEGFLRFGDSDTGDGKNEKNRPTGLDKTISFIKE